MKSVTTATMGLVVASILTSGCTSLFQRSNEFRITGIGPAETTDAASARRVLESGRLALANEQYGVAISSFREARLVPEAAADAYNGMAIAYSKIGRPDLAERFFRQAIAEAPADQRYRRNLARFHEQIHESAVRTVQGTPSVPVAQASQPRILASTAGNAVIRIELPTPRLVRVASNEMQIGSGVPAETMRRRNPNYPQRVSFAVSPSVKSGANYPARVSFLTTD